VSSSEVQKKKLLERFDTFTVYNKQARKEEYNNSDFGLISSKMAPDGKIPLLQDRVVPE